MLRNTAPFDDSTSNLVPSDDTAKQKEGAIIDQLAKTIAMETGGKYRNYSCKRRIEKDKTDHYRKGPAPIEESDSITKSTSKATYGTLDSDVEDLDFEEVRHQNSKNNYYNKLRLTTNEKGDNLASCRATIVYFSKLAKSKDEEELIDLNFVESLLENGADINFPDRHGQTILHEISRGWNPDVARFAIEHGADINKSDTFGRTPLHLAAAVDYDDMVQFLVDNGADLGAKTFGEEQTAMHYAAKNNAASSLKVMLRLGARINDRDYKRRTPLFVAAETARTEAARFLVDRGAPAGVYDSSGTSCLSLMIEKMPQIAIEAVEQFHLLDLAFRKHYYYLSYLERDPNFMIDYIPESKRERIEQKERRKAEKRLLKDSGQRVLKKEKSYAKTPLEVIVQYDQLDIIMHPVFQRLLHVKWSLFGKRGSAKMLALNFLYTLIWTILGIMIPRDHKYYLPFADNWWRLVLEFLGVSMTAYFIFMEITQVRNNEKKHNNWRQWRTRHMEKDLVYCHPRWPEERQYLTSELLQIRGYQRTYFRDPWNIFEWVSYMVILTLVFTRVLSVASGNETAANIHPKVYALGLIVIWLRFMRSCRVFQTLGPFIAILGSVIVDTAKFSFLLFEFFVPYTVGFWIIFGGPENASLMVKKDWEQFNDLTFSVFTMTLMGGFDWDGLVAVDRLMAQILCGSYFALSGVVCMNLYIALLSDTFARVYGQAKATAVMQQAKSIITLEGKLSKFHKSKYAHYMLRECSPQEVYTREESHDPDEKESEMLERVSRQIVNRIDSLEDNMLFQYKKMAPFDPPPFRDQNADFSGGEDDGFDSFGGGGGGFGGSGPGGGDGGGMGGAGGGSGCRHRFDRMIELQRSQYTDVKEEMHNLKMMMMNINALLQGKSRDCLDSVDPNTRGVSPISNTSSPYNKSTYGDNSNRLPKTSRSMSAAFLTSPPQIQHQPHRRTSDVPAEISSLLKNIQDLNAVDRTDSDPNIKSSLPTLVEYPDNRLYKPAAAYPPIESNQNPYPPPPTATSAAYPPPIAQDAYPPTPQNILPALQDATQQLYPPLNPNDRRNSRQDITNQVRSPIATYPQQVQPGSRQQQQQQQQQHQQQQQQNYTPPPPREFGRNTSTGNGGDYGQNTPLIHQDGSSRISSSNSLNMGDGYSDFDGEVGYQSGTTGRGSGRRRRRKKKQSTYDNVPNNNIPMYSTETM